ncbi:protein pxr1 isoform X2 [Megalops cyprinoides]|nr:protein pxr1 isoform X2 [Megalops cyprinoides]XP_036407825.1 protein pxr1 isoform X2 [Megalops cyprinoides]
MRSPTVNPLQVFSALLLCILPHKAVGGQSDEVVYGEPQRGIVIFLFILLALLILLLVYLYKRLNRETDGQYTVRQLVYGKGGVRERVQNGVTAIENRLGVRLRPRKAEDIEGGEEDDDREEEERERERASRKDEDSLAEEEQQQDEDSSDYSSLEGVDLRERKQLQENAEVKVVSEGEKAEEKGECKKEKEEEKGTGGEEKNSETGAAAGGLLADLKDFSGSAIWAEEQKEGDVTLL